MNKSITFILTLSLALAMTLSPSVYAQNNNTSSNNNNNNKNNNNPPEAQQQPSEPVTPPAPTTTEPITPQENNPPPLIPPSTTNPPAEHTAGGPGPDQSCLFHPEQSKCKSDNGKCPTGFNQNEDGNCFPKHDKCPKGFHGHEDDETGRCIPDSVPCQEGYIRDPNFPTCSSKSFLCKDHPELRGCKGTTPDQNDRQHHVIVIKQIITKHTTSHNKSSHSLSTECYFTIRDTWIAKIQRGENSQIDKIMADCLAL